MIVVADGTTPPYDPDTRIHIPIDSPMRRFYAEHVAFLDARDHVGLVDGHYHDDAIVMSTEYVVVGREALLAHFAKYAGLMARLEVVTTDRWVESDTTFAFEATARTQWGLSRVHDAFVIRDGRIVRHFTGSIPLIR
jgi:hypothetical protein